MGQSSFNCEAKPATPRDLLSRQLSIYQWRSDPIHNSFVARVAFKNAYTQKQEQKFAEFLQKQEQEDYLEIYKFRQEMEDFRKLSAEEVIVFQKYACTLAELHGRLKIEDVLYTLHSLLLGFEELRKIFERISVEDCCCFVTMEGEVRAWINPNPKSNQIWSGLQDELPLEVNIRNILTKIVAIAERIALRSAKTDQFFSAVKAMLSKSALKHCYQADTRRVINDFCYFNNIQMGKNLMEVLRMRELQGHFRKSYKTDHSNTETSELCPRDRIVYLPTVESEANFHNKSLLIKSKSVQARETMKNRNQMRQSFMGQPLVQMAHRTVSRIIPTISFDLAKQRNSHIEGKAAKESTLRGSNEFKNSGFLGQHIFEVESVKSSNQMSNNHIHNKPQLALHRQSVQMQCPQNEKRESKTEKAMKGKQTNGKMMISIMAGLTSSNNDENCPPLLHRPENYHKTCIERHSVQANSQSQVYWSRPWITNKTITKLISQNDPSLKNSIGQSSDYYNDSVYSGALTHLGRDIAPQNADRSKTVRISRDR